MGLFSVTCTGTRAWTPASGPRTFLSATGTNTTVSKSASCPLHVAKLASQAVFPGRPCLSPDPTSQLLGAPSAPTSDSSAPLASHHTLSHRAVLTLFFRSATSPPQSWLCTVPLPATHLLKDAETPSPPCPACSLCHSQPHTHSPRPALHTSPSAASPARPRLPSFITASKGTVTQGSAPSLTPRVSAGQYSCWYCFLCPGVRFLMGLVSSHSCCKVQAQGCLLRFPPCERGTNGPPFILLWLSSCASILMLLCVRLL